MSGSPPEETSPSTTRASSHTNQARGEAACEMGLHICFIFDSSLLCTVADAAQKCRIQVFPFYSFGTSSYTQCKENARCVMVSSIQCDSSRVARKSACQSSNISCRSPKLLLLLRWALDHGLLALVVVAATDEGNGLDLVLLWGKAALVLFAR